MYRPTEARKRFGSRLKKLRESRRWRQHEVAAMLSYNTDFYRHVEAGRRTPPSTLGARIDQIYEIPYDLMADLCDEAQRDQTPINELRENEQSATQIRIWEHRLIPGLLQTEDYARTIQPTERALADQMERQKILTREDPVRLKAVLDEAVLWRWGGEPALFRDQLLHLLQFHVQILPLSAGLNVGTEGPQIILDFGGRPTFIWREAQGIGTIADSDEAVDRAREVWEAVLGSALSLENSKEMIRAIADEFSEDE